MDKKTQCQRILEYLKTHNGITSKEAMDKLGVARLASRICDLKELGYEVVKVSERGRDRYGMPTHYTRYFVKGITNGRMDKTTQTVA